MAPSTASSARHRPMNLPRKCYLSRVDCPLSDHQQQVTRRLPHLYRSLKLQIKDALHPHPPRSHSLSRTIQRSRTPKRHAERHLHYLRSRQRYRTYRDTPPPTLVLRRQRRDCHARFGRSLSLKTRRLQRLHIKPLRHTRRRRRFEELLRKRIHIRFITQD